MIVNTNINYKWKGCLLTRRFTVKPEFSKFSRMPLPTGLQYLKTSVVSKIYVKLYSTDARKTVRRYIIS